MSGKLKTSGSVPAIVCFVFLFVLTPAARSADKTTWLKYDNAVPGDTNTTSTYGRIPLGTSGKGDDTTAMCPAVIKDGATYKMWYTGYDAPPAPQNYRIYHASSPDGLTWTKKDNNIPGASDSICTNGTIALGTDGTGDAKHVMAACVIQDDSIYKMWYSGSDGTNYRIYHATSSNGLTWVKYSNSIPAASNTTGTYGRIPLGTNGTGDDKWTSYPMVIKEGPTYKMWYTGRDDAGNQCRIFYATSTNGLTWVKYDNNIPGASDSICTNGTIALGTSGGDEKHARQATVVKIGSVYKMWYNGQDDPGSTNRVYYATSTDGLTWKKYDNSIPDPSNTTSTNGRIPLGETGGDTDAITYPCVIKDGYTYKMWYTGTAGNNRIYHATLDALPAGMIFIGH